MRGNNAGKTSVLGFVKRMDERPADANVQGLKRREAQGFQIITCSRGKVNGYWSLFWDIDEKRLRHK